MLRERFITLLAEKDWSLEYFSEVSGVPLETAKNIKLGKTTNPRLDTLEKTAAAFGLSINCLIGKCPHTPEEKALLRNYRSCGTHGKSIIQLIAKYEATSAKSDRESKDKHKIPCLVPHGDVSKGIIYDACETKEIETSVSEAYVAIMMPTNTFAPHYCKGDVVLFENRFPNHGECAAFYKTDRAYIRKFIEEDRQYRLKCLHSQGEDIILKRMDEIEYIGTCCGVVRN